MENRLVIARCARSRLGFAIRYDHHPDGNWWASHVINLEEKEIARGGYGRAALTGSFFMAATYPGCPHCSARSIFKCGQCSQINCWNTMDRVVSCVWCGGGGELAGTLTDLNTVGDV